MAYITAIQLGPGTSEEHITACSVLYDYDGTTYRFSPKSIVDLMDKGQKFYVGSPKGKVEVVPVRPAGRTPYIRTKPDGTATNNLLALSYIR